MADLAQQIKEIYILVDGKTEKLFDNIKFTQLSKFHEKYGTMFYITEAKSLEDYHSNINIAVPRFSLSIDEKPCILPNWVIQFEKMFHKKMKEMRYKYAAVLFLNNNVMQIEFLSNSLEDLTCKIEDILIDMSNDLSNEEGSIDKSEERFREIALSLADLYSKKNPVYGNSFGRSLKKYGKISGLTRISDKFNRLEKIITSKEIDTNDESLEDTLLDLASYCIMMKMALEESNETKS